MHRVVACGRILYDKGSQNKDGISYNKDLGERQADMEARMAQFGDDSHPKLQTRVLQTIIYQQACLPQPRRISRPISVETRRRKEKILYPLPYITPPALFSISIPQKPIENTRSNRSPA